MAKKLAKPIRLGGGRTKRTITPQEREFLRSVGARIQDRRLQKRITGDSLGRMVGITGVTESRRETGNFDMPLADLFRYAKALGCDPKDLLP